MPIFRDRDGNYFAIPSKDLQQYKVSREEVRKLIPTPGRDADDVELQSDQVVSHPWYTGD